MPFFSIITPAYNVEKYISTTIESVINQTYTDWEMIIVDDESTDGTSEIIETFCSVDSRVKLIKQKNKKQAAARNKGIKHSTGTWICFLDGDDYWLPEKLATQLKFINTIEADVFYTGGYKFDEAKALKSSFHILNGKSSSLQMYQELYKANTIPILSVALKASLITVVGFQDEDPEIVGCEDLDYWLRFAAKGAIFYGIDAKLFMYRLHTENISKNIFQMQLALVIVLIKNFDRRYFRKQEVVNAFHGRFDPLVLALLKRNQLEKAKVLLSEFEKIHEGIYLKLDYVLLIIFNKHSFWLIKLVNKFNRMFEAELTIIKSLPGV